MRDKILINISGWGSDEQIFRDLFVCCPELQGYRHIFLPWQDFVATSQARLRLEKTLEKTLPKRLEKPLEKLPDLNDVDILFLGWSLGSLLCLELALELAMKLAPKLDTVRAAMILLSPSAAMCKGKTGVNPTALKLMQRKLEKYGEQVLLDFARNCGKAEQSRFVSCYLERAKRFLESAPESLHMGLDYLIHCDLSEALAGVADFPCLLVSGLHDKIIPTSQAVALAQLLPRAELLQIDAGHNLLIPPSEQLVGGIRRFIADL